MSNSLEGQDSEDKIMKITIKGKDGENSNLWIDLEQWEHIQDWNSYSEYLFYRYPPMMMYQYPQYRIPDRKGEEDSFESWKSRGKPKPSLFSYGNLIKKDYKEIKKLLGL